MSERRRRNKGNKTTPYTAPISPKEWKLCINVGEHNITKKENWERGFRGGRREVGEEGKGVEQKNQVLLCIGTCSPRSCKLHTLQADTTNKISLHRHKTLSSETVGPSRRCVLNKGAATLKPRGN